MELQGRAGWRRRRFCPAGSSSSAYRWICRGVRLNLRSFGSCCVVLMLAAARVSAASHDVRLVDAAKKRQKAEVRALLKQRVDVNAMQADGATALHWAAHWGDDETVELL